MSTSVFQLNTQLNFVIFNNDVIRILILVCLFFFSRSLGSSCCLSFQIRSVSILLYSSSCLFLPIIVFARNGNCFKWQISDGVYGVREESWEQREWRLNWSYMKKINAWLGSSVTLSPCFIYGAKTIHFYERQFTYMDDNGLQINLFQITQDQTPN